MTAGCNCSRQVLHWLINDSRLAQSTAEHAPDHDGAQLRGDGRAETRSDVVGMPWLRRIGKAYSKLLHVVSMLE